MPRNSDQLVTELSAISQLFIDVQTKEVGTTRAGQYEGIALSFPGYADDFESALKEFDQLSKVPHTGLLHYSDSEDRLADIHSDDIREFAEKSRRIAQDLKENKIEQLAKEYIGVFNHLETISDKFKILLEQIQHAHVLTPENKINLLKQIINLALACLEREDMPVWIQVAIPARKMNEINSLVFRAKSLIREAVEVCQATTQNEHPLLTSVAKRINLLLGYNSRYSGIPLDVKKKQLIADKVVIMDLQHLAEEKKQEPTAVVSAQLSYREQDCKDIYPPNFKFMFPVHKEQKAKSKIVFKRNETGNGRRPC